MSRYIDADKAPSVMKEMPLCKQCIDAVMKMVIDRLPSEDVVEVIRCKNCAYWTDKDEDTITEKHWGECRRPLGDYRHCETAEYDYCSYGERREG